MKRIWCLAAALLLLPSAALAAVSDNGQIFTSAGIASANKIIDDIRLGTLPHKEVVVVTLATLPSPDIDAQQIAEQAFRQQRIDGVLLLIVKSPKKLVITLGRNTQSRFTKVEELRGMILSEFKKGRFDEGLNSGLSFLQQELQTAFPLSARQRPIEGRQPIMPSAETSASPAALQTQPPTGGSGLGGILIFGLIIFAVMRLLGGLGRMGGFGRGAGGSFMTGVLGGLAGNWLYNRFMGGGSGSAWSSGLGGYPDQGMGGSGLSDDGVVGSSSSGSWDDGGSSGGGGGGDW